VHAVLCAGNFRVETSLMRGQKEDGSGQHFSLCISCSLRSKVGIVERFHRARRKLIIRHMVTLEIDYLYLHKNYEIEQRIY